MNTGQQLVDKLDTLREHLYLLSDRLNKSGIERTNGLRKYMGEDCEFYQKSLDILLSKDYIDLRNLVNQCADLFLQVEGNNGKK